MKHFFLLVLFATTTFAGFSQKKGRAKTKSNKTQTSSTIPNPGNPSVKPEVGEKSPQIYSTDTPGSAPGQGQVGAPTSAPKDTTAPVGAGQQQPGSAPGIGMPSGPTPAPGSGNTKPITTDPQPGRDGKEPKLPKGEKGTKDHKKEHKEKHDGEKHNHDDKEHESGSGNEKVRDNIPSRVEKAFKVDYPAASNPVWTKQNGNWTATFNNNGVTTTATYHSNGEKAIDHMPGKKKEVNEMKEKKNKKY
jgi:hypothetical protein